MLKETTKTSITDPPLCRTCKYYMTTESPHTCRYPVPEWMTNVLRELVPDRAQTLTDMFGDEGHTCTAWERDESKPFPFGTPHLHKDGTHGFGCCFGSPSGTKKSVTPGYYWREYRGMSAMVQITDAFMVLEFGSTVQQSMDCFPNAIWKFVKIKK